MVRDLPGFFVPESQDLVFKFVYRLLLHLLVSLLFFVLLRWAGASNLTPESGASLGGELRARAFCLWHFLGRQGGYVAGAVSGEDSYACFLVALKQDFAGDFYRLVA